MASPLERRKRPAAQAELRQARWHRPRQHAAAFDAKIKRELDTGTSLDIKAGQLKVRDYAAEYRRDLLHRDSTAERLERVFRLHVNPLTLGNLPMIRVRPSHMRSWVKTGQKYSRHPRSRSSGPT